MRELIELPGFEVVDNVGEWKQVDDVPAVQTLAKVLAGGGPHRYTIGNSEYEARRERDASGSILFTQVNVKTRIARELRATPSLFAYRDDFGQMQHVRDASAAFVHSLATGESQFFERDNVVYMTEVEADGALFQRNTQTQTRRRVRQLVPGSGAASPASPAPQEVTLTFSFQMDNGRWQQVCEAAACTAIMAVHRDGGTQRFSSSANKGGTQYDYEVRDSRGSRAPHTHARTRLCTHAHDWKSTGCTSALHPRAIHMLLYLSRAVSGLHARHDARPQVRKEDDDRLVQRNVKTGTERELRVARSDSLSKAGALQLLRIGVPLAPGLHTPAGNPRLKLLVTGEGACSSSFPICRPSPLHACTHTSLSWVRVACKPPPPQTKEDAVMHIAHAAIFDANAVVYGGFVRDYIVRNESANDVDVNTADYDATEKQITAALKSLHIIEQDPHVKQWGKQNLYRRLTYDWQGHKLEVDLVDPAKVPRAPYRSALLIWTSLRP